MKCLSCKHTWKRTKFTEYVSLLSSCPKCGGREATCELRQMDQTDEPEVAFLECQICNHGWRD